jgi:hypothetical protein
MPNDPARYFKYLIQIAWAQQYPCSRPGAAKSENKRIKRLPLWLEKRPQ